MDRLLVSSTPILARNNAGACVSCVLLDSEARQEAASLFPTLEAASRIYDVPLNTLRWWIQTGKLGPAAGLCYIGKTAHLDARRFENALLQRRGPRPRRDAGSLPGGFGEGRG
jgi:hypothetical protein